FVGPVLAPFDLKGIGLITYRFIDPGQQDMSFLYLPALRRVRRLSTAQRSDALLGTDADPDSFWGYGGHIAWMQWRFLGEREMLGVLHGEHYPIQRCPGAADFMFCDAWEKRTVYAIEGISKLAQYAYGKRVIYVDKQAMVVAYEDIFDKAGELWKVWIDNHQFRDQAYPGARKYPEEQDFYAGLLMLDMQLEHATYVPHPAVEGHEGWFFNEGPNARTDASGAGSVSGRGLARRLCRPRHGLRTIHRTAHARFRADPRQGLGSVSGPCTRRVIAGASEVEMAGGRRKARPRARRAPKPAPIALEPVDLLAGLAPGVELHADHLPPGIDEESSATTPLPATLTVAEAGR